MSAPGDEGARLLALLTDIAIISQLTGSAATRALAPKLGLSEYGLLNHMMRCGDGKTPSQLARTLQVSKPSITATIGRLQAKGLARLEHNSDDGRSKRLFLTAAGRAARAAAQRRLQALQKELFAGFDVAALLDHADAIAALREHLDAQRRPREELA